MPSKTINSMKVSNKKTPVKKRLEVKTPEPVPSSPALPEEKELKVKKSKKRSGKKSKMTSPEDAILQSSAVDPDLEKAVKPKKTATKKALPKKRSAKKAAAKKKTAKKPASKKAKR